jgi:hypothetical protein
MEMSITNKHTVLQQGGEFFVVYPTPGLENVPTLALICRTEQQAQEQCDRLNGGLQ